MILWTLVGCTSLLTIEIDEKATTVVEKGTLVEELLDAFGFDGFITMDLTQSDELVNQGVGPEDIDSVRLTLLELEAIDPVGADLGFFESLEFSVEAPDLDEKRVASSSAFTDGEDYVALELEDVELKPYVISESMSLTTEVSAHRPDEDTTVRAHFVVEVEATVQGVRNNL